MLDEPTPAASATTAQPGLNASSLNALRALDPNGGAAFVQRVLSTYLRSLDKHVDTLRVASAGGDLTTLRGVVHTLKSSSASIGALAFAQSSAELETVVRERLAHPVAGTDPLVGLAELFANYLGLAAQVRMVVVAELNGTAS